MMLAADILLTAAVLVLAYAWRQSLGTRESWGDSQKTVFRIVTVFAIVSLALRFVPILSQAL